MMRLLIADDERIIRKGISKVIMDSGKDWKIVGEASDGTDVLDFIKKEVPDVLITDIRMAEMGGLELGKIIKKNYPDILIIIISGYPQFEFAREAIKFEALDFLLKPTEPSELINVLSKAEHIIKEREEQKKELDFSGYGDRAQQQAEGEPLLAAAQETNLASSRQKCRRVILESIEYMNKHYGRDLTLKGLADIAHINSNYFCDLFKQEAGMNFSDYLMHIRIEHAKELLKSKATMRSNEIAELVGYKNCKYFSSVFRKQVGCTPTEFREDNAGRAK